MESSYKERLLAHKKKRNVGNFCYDAEEKKVCGRTLKSWCQILAFFVAFYSFLVGFWSICLYVFLKEFINDQEPKYTLEESRISGIGNPGVKPGIALVPRMPDQLDHDHGRQFNWFMDESGKTFLNDLWINGLQKFIEYHEKGKNETVNCSEDDHEYHENDVCRFDLETLEECGKLPFGYYAKNELEPCVFIKINKIYKFKPEPFSSNFTDVPKWLDTSELKTRMENEPRKIYVECHGKSKREDDLIRGKFRYFPEDAGISFRFFPYHKIGRPGLEFEEERQKSPLIALQLMSSFPRNQLVRMECYAYYKNVVHDRMTRQGLFQFNVKINA